MESERLSSRVHRRLRVVVVPMGLVLSLVVGSAAFATSAGATPKKVHHPKFVVFSAPQSGIGTFLTTQAGKPLYVFTGDTQNNSMVPGQIFAPAWPALTVPPGDVLFAGRGIVGLGTFTLPNGQVQVTWQGLPLYTFIKDTTPNVETGQGRVGFVVAFVQLQKKK